MIVRLESGIPGFDELTSDQKTGIGGLPENTTTLIYGPPKTGKSIFCYQFMYRGLQKDEPCLYLLTDYGLNQLDQNAKHFNFNLDEYIQNEMLYIIDTASGISETAISETETYKTSSVNNPTEIMIKLKTGTQFLFKKYSLFRSLLDSMTTLLAFNDDMLVIRVLKAYILRVKEAGGTLIITYTEGSADPQIETMLKALVDNIIRFDGENVSIEAMVGCGKRKAPYEITDEGINIKEREI
ncbi:MAG: ATPase [Methanobacterium sp.]|uniref:RAD55 family ATPase n=1 Tax=Methanobacterium sp. TaxID=2164 RepID=UPI003D64CE91|nr:ATPase [Methanobacterium sp.]